MPSARETEVAAENVLRAHYGCDETRRALRTKYNKVDFFGADVIGRNGEDVFWVQVTRSTPSSAGHPKREGLMHRADGEPRHYHPRDRPMVFYYEDEAHPDDGRRKVYRFKVQEWVNFGVFKASSWAWREPVTFPRSHFQTG